MIGDPGSVGQVSVRSKHVQTFIANSEADMHLSPPRPAVQVENQIIGERAGRIYFLDVHEVAYLESAGNYVATHVGSDEFLTRATLKSMSTQLSLLGFMQIERSLVINLRQVAHVERRDRGKYCFVMRSGQRLVSSRERSASIRALLLGASSRPGL
jgi:DNA-binding LytR/AlgR family response regulator